MTMRVLFVPAHQRGAISHGIPLLALSRRLDASFTSAFLVPKRFWDFFRGQGANVLDIDHDNLTTQRIAHHRFKPDAVVDDLSFTTALAHQLMPFPRITLQRTGSFPDEATLAEDREHTADEQLRAMPDLSLLGLAQPRHITDMVKGDAVIVPGIRSVDVLPDRLQNDPRYFYSGPLLIDDSSSPRGSPRADDFGLVDAFLERHARRQIVLFTFGTIAHAPRFLQTHICKLLEQGRAVISTVAIASLPAERSALFLHREFLPFHRICARASLMIHHCGCGTSQYPLLHGLPAITLATGYRDRDDVALRLETLGAAIHLDPAHERFDSRFAGAVRGYLEPGGRILQTTRAALSRLKREENETAASFDFAKVIDRALTGKRLRYDAATTALASSHCV